MDLERLRIIDEKIRKYDGIDKLLKQSVSKDEDMKIEDEKESKSNKNKTNENT